MARFRWAIAAVLVAAWLGLWAYYDSGAPLSGSSTQLQDLGPAANVGVRTASGVQRLSDLKGKVVLLDFWATWCAPCRESIPALQRLYESRRDRGFAVLGISLDHPSTDLDSFRRILGMTYPSGHFLSREEIAPYGPNQIPLMVLVDRNGRVRYRQEGYAPFLEEALEKAVDRLLAE